MAHQIEPIQDHPNIEIGRVIHENTYTRENKEIKFDDMVIDIFFKSDRDTVIAEIKKSSKFEKSSKMQLAFYLMKLKEKGIDLKGEIRFPLEKKKVKFQLTSNIEQELNRVCKEIKKIYEQEEPPKLEKTKYCWDCGYYELCWI
ncbi:MAG: CRISPR-associated protein Cas4 [Candidatus Omnitrophica bacterium]|nr:CRISPR-associated protein Cas4 [Candidatus Omnitrophota bacterium]